MHFFLSNIKKRDTMIRLKLISTVRSIYIAYTVYVLARQVFYAIAMRDNLSLLNCMDENGCTMHAHTHTHTHTID